MNTKEYTHTIHNLPESQIEVRVEIPWTTFAPYREKALEAFAKTIEIKGFRAGKAPMDVVASHVGEGALLEEAAKDAVAEAYDSIMKENPIRTLEYPAITITKLAPNNPLTFTATVSILPTIELPDYKKIAHAIMSKKEAPIEATEKDVTDAIDDIRRHIARKEHEHKHATGEPHEHVENDKDLPLPPLTEEFVKAIGDFKDIADFKEKIRAGVLKEKNARAKNMRRLAMGEKLVQSTKLDVPKSLVRHELDKLETRFRHDVEHMGVALDDYLAHIKKTVDDLRKEWTDDARKRAALQLIVSTIAEKEKISPEKEVLEKEVASVMDQYKDARREHVEGYVLTVLTNEKVFEFLEQQ